MKKKIVITVAILIIAIISLTAYRYYYLITRNIVDVLIAQKRLINILVAGSNVYRENRHRFYCIVSVNPENGKIGITFLPPELQIAMGSRGTDVRKLCEIDFSDFTELRESLQREIKLNVPFYVELYAVDVERIVDFVRGVDIFILDQIPLGKGYIFGQNYFDGRKVLKYINEVPGGSIFKKFDRIQDVAFAMYSSKERFDGVFSYEFVQELIKFCKTNIMPQELYSLGKLVLKKGVLSCTVLPCEVDDSGQYRFDEISYKIYEKEFLTSLVKDEENVSAIKVKILNGTDIPGLARKMRNLLIREGLNVVEFGTSPYPKLPYSILINQRGNYINTNKTAELTGIKHIYHVIDNTQLHDVLIILGKESLKGEEE
ncbi:MAG: LytR C-terminal domain-containing protein [Spirochaetes bacterium]|nr:LytR C-terminal domain-containing protein [Spirochaetota bacterium]